MQITESGIGIKLEISPDGKWVNLIQTKIYKEDEKPFFVRRTYWDKTKGGIVVSDKSTPQSILIGTSVEEAEMTLKAMLAEMGNKDAEAEAELRSDGWEPDSKQVSGFGLGDIPF